VVSTLDCLRLMYGRHLVSVRFIISELDDRGKSLSDANATITVEDLWDLDQDHFGGKDATARCIELCCIGQHGVVLDLGSGLGGTARHMACVTGCRVEGVEVQPDRCEFSELLTRRVGLSSLVTFTCADAEEYIFPTDHYTHMTAFLSILHFRHKERVLSSMGGWLRQGGTMYIEDYYADHRLSDSEKQALLNAVACPGLISQTGYLECLARGGVEVRSVEDTTTEWSRLVRQRCEDYERERPRNESVHGREVVARAIGFAHDVDSLFQHGIVRGIRVVGVRR